jgi:hypothetical protein
MAKMSPSSTAAIILGRFYKRLIPSFDLRIKGEFIDMVSLLISILIGEGTSGDRKTTTQQETAVFVGNTASAYVSY